jgi:hypothetical protein
MIPKKPITADEDFDLMRNDALIRWQRKLRIAPQQGLGVVRRAIFFALATWLPLAVWAAMKHRLLEAESGEPLLAHFGIHVRCLVAIPLFILAEAMTHQVIGRIVGQFRASGAVTDQQYPAFLAVLKDMARLRDSSFPWIFLISLAFAWTVGSPVDTDVHEMSWAMTGGDFGFGGWWFLYVARPVFLVLLLGWLWRIALVILLFRRLSKLDLSLVPTHPDRCGGLGFVKKLPSALFLVTMAVSSVLASRWMHDMVYHEQTLAALKLPFAGFVVLWSAMLLSPLLMLAPRISAMKRQALLQYGALIGEHGRLVHQRWILGKQVPQNDLLDAPELGPVADTAAIYEAVKNVRPLPIDTTTLLMVLLPIFLPMLFVIARQIPIRDLLLQLLKTVV